MRTLKTTLLIVFFLFLAPSISTSQNYQSFGVHEDVVKPSHIMEYGGVVKELLGDEGEKPMFDMYSNVLKYVKAEGEIRPDLSYSSKE